MSWPKTRNPVAVVTGGSSGIGAETCRALLQRGCSVYAISRRGQAPEGAVALSADVTDEAGIRAAVETVTEQAGRIDILINNAGFGISGAAEFTDNADAKRLLEADLFGVVNLTKAVLPVMRRQGGGRIVNVSSVAAPIAIPFQAWYSAAKAAVSAYSDAVQGEVRPFGITVCTVQPGDIRTGFTAAREKKHVGDDVYGGRIGRSVAVMEKDEQNGMDPAAAGEAIAKAALRGRAKPVTVIGGKYRLFVFLLRLLPRGFVRKVVDGMYGK